MSENEKHLHGNYAKVDRHSRISPIATQYVVTDNKTDRRGNVENRLASDAEFCRKCVDENHK